MLQHVIDSEKLWDATLMRAVPLLIFSTEQSRNELASGLRMLWESYQENSVDFESTNRRVAEIMVNITAKTDDRTRLKISRFAESHQTIDKRLSTLSQKIDRLESKMAHGGHKHPVTTEKKAPKMPTPAPTSTPEKPEEVVPRKHPVVPRKNIPNRISKYIGTSMTGNGKWQAQIGHDKKRTYIGMYDTEEEAARAYDAEAVKLGRPTNFTNSTPVESGPREKILKYAKEHGSITRKQATEITGGNVDRKHMLRGMADEGLLKHVSAHPGDSRAHYIIGHAAKQAAPAPENSTPVVLLEDDGKNGPGPSVQYTGVKPSDGTHGHYAANITVNGIKIYIGTFPTAEQAARAYDDAVRSRGLDRPLNFPE